MDSNQAPAASALQLSTFTKVPSIPRPEKYPNFPVAVRLTAPGANAPPVRAPVDIVAAVDVSQSSRTNDPMLELEKAAVALVIERLGADDRLAVVPFCHEVQKDDKAKELAKLVRMTGDGKKTVGDLVKARHFAPGGSTSLIKPIVEAEKILGTRGDADRRAAFIILLSDGDDGGAVTKDKVWSREGELKDGIEYPVHTFGFTNVAKHATLQLVAARTKGEYFPRDIAGDGDLQEFAAAFERLLRDATSRPFSAEGASVTLAAMHPGVSISRIDDVSREEEKMAGVISGDARSGHVDVGQINAGEALQFTVYLDVPEGDTDADAMDVLSVEGAYTQGWDGNAVKIGRSVVSVKRPVPPPPPPPEPKITCEELLNKIEERLEYWCKVKQDLAAMDEKADAGAGNKCQCTSTKVLREAALESINRAMHIDIYTVAVQVVKMRRCGDGGSDSLGDTTAAVDGTTTDK